MPAEVNGLATVALVGRHEHDAALAVRGGPRPYDCGSEACMSIEG